MSQEEILSRLQPTIASVIHLSAFEVKKYPVSASLVDDLGFDSLDFIDLTLATNLTFNIRVPMENLGQINTIQDWINYISPYVNAE